MLSANKILVTGSKGFIGSHLMTLLPGATGFDLENETDDAQEDIAQWLPDEKFTHIFHLAASKSVPLGEKYAKQFIINNCWGTTNLIKTYPNARIINISSSAANECRSVYGMTKRFAELVGDTHPNCLNVRLYNVFGEGQSLESGAVVPQFIKCSLCGGKPTIYGDGSQLRDFTYVGDVVEELVRLMFATKDTGLHHLGCSNPLTVLELCRRICGDTEINFMPKRSFEIHASSSPTLMMMTYGREEGLKRTIQWGKDMKKAVDDSFIA